MKTLHYIPYPIFHPWFNFDLELVATHLDAGDDVTVVGCNEDFLACDFNPQHLKSTCLDCRGKRAMGFSLLPKQPKFRSLLQLDAADQKRLRELKTEFESLDELKALRLDDFDLGWAVLASVIWLTRDPYPSPREQAALMRDLALSGAAAYLSFRRLLAAEKFDRIYQFNGKHATMRAVLRACQSFGVDCFGIEAGHHFTHYELFPNVLPHDVAFSVGRICKRWEEAAGDPQRDATANRFYEERAKGVTQSWFSFIGGQTPGLLPADWNPNRRNIVVFTSSQDEFGAIGEEWIGPVYKDQLTGLTRILEALRGREDFHLTVRVHPNLKDVRNEHELAVQALRAPNLTLIPPADPASSYALMAAAEKVLSFGSTAGIEAAYWGKPSICAGMSFYRQLGSTYDPTTHDELISMLTADLAPLDKTGALSFGCYYRTFGIPLKYVDPVDPYTGRFNGVVIAPTKAFGRAAKLMRMVPAIDRAAGSSSRENARRRYFGNAKA